MTAEQRKTLAAKVREWRARAGKVGPLHSLWETIFDAEAALDGKESLLTIEQLMDVK